MDTDLNLGIGRLHTWLGHACARKDEHAAAQEHYTKGQAAFVRGGDEVAAANVELSVGNLAGRANKLRDAEAAYRKVRLRFESLDDTLGLATSLSKELSRNNSITLVLQGAASRL